jgi:hypothetical protein
MQNLTKLFSNKSKLHELDFAYFKHIHDFAYMKLRRGGEAIYDQEENIMGRNLARKNKAQYTTVIDRKIDGNRPGHPKERTASCARRLCVHQHQKRIHEELLLREVQQPLLLSRSPSPILKFLLQNPTARKGRKRQLLEDEEHQTSRHISEI